MTDHSDKSWLRSVGYLAPSLRAAERAAFVIGIAAIVVGLHLWGVWVGTRDAQLMCALGRETAAQADRDAIGACEGAAYRHLESGRIVCFTGPMRLLPRGD